MSIRWTCAAGHLHPDRTQLSMGKSGYACNICREEKKTAVEQFTRVCEQTGLSKELDMRKGEG